VENYFTGPAGKQKKRKRISPLPPEKSRFRLPEKFRLDFPFPFEHLFANIKKDLGLTTEMMILVTENIDEESKKVLMEKFSE